jgi:hypothetical protein
MVGSGTRLFYPEVVPAVHLSADEEHIAGFWLVPAAPHPGFLAAESHRPMLSSSEPASNSEKLTRPMCRAPNTHTGPWIGASGRTPYYVEV